MRQGPAFRFVPQLLDGVSNVLLHSNNPIRLYIESGIETINMATSLLQLIAAHKNTFQTEVTFNEASERYQQLLTISMETLSQEKNDEKERKYLAVKQCQKASGRRLPPA